MRCKPAATPIFPTCPTSRNCVPREIIPGVGLGPICFGMSQEKIESLLGKPDGYEANQTSLLYYSRGFVLSVSHRSGLKSIRCISQMLTMNRVRDFAGKTKEGIGIGSTFGSRKSFGKPDRDEGHDAFNKRLVYTKFGLEIQFVDDKVIIVEMSEVPSPAGKPSDETTDPREKQTPKTAQRTLNINVVGPDGKPVAGVKIRDGIWSKTTAKTNSNHVSDAQGQTVIELPDKLDILRLFTSCNGYVPLFTHWEELDEYPPDIFTITLTKGTLIGGLVKNEEGQPIAGAKVEVMMAHDPAAQQKRTSFTSRLAEEDDAKTTDAAGTMDARQRSRRRSQVTLEDQSSRLSQRCNLGRLAEGTKHYARILPTSESHNYHAPEEIAILEVVLITKRAVFC